MRPLVWLVVLSALVVVGVLVYPYLNTPSSSLGQDQAVAFVMDDVKPLQDQGVDARVVAARPIANDSTHMNQWSVEVLLTHNAHSRCPLVDKRFYTLPPIGFRTEPIVASCSRTVSIDYREQALIDTAAALPTLSDAAYGCAFLYQSDRGVSSFDAAYCPQADLAALASFASDVPSGSWVVFWQDGGAVHYIALSASGQPIKSA